MRFMRATGNLVFISMLRGLGFLVGGAEEEEGKVLRWEELVDVEDDAWVFTPPRGWRGGRVVIVGGGLYS